MGTASDDSHSVSRDPKLGVHGSAEPCLAGTARYGASVEVSDALDELHYAVGFMTAALAIPEPLEWEECFEYFDTRSAEAFETGEDEEDPELEAAQVPYEALKALFVHVGERLAEGALASLIPSGQDAAACDEWIEGFAAAANHALHDLSREEIEISSRIFARPGRDETRSREVRKALARESLTVDVTRLTELWSEVPPYDPEQDAVRWSQVVPKRPFQPSEGRVIHSGGTFVRPEAKVGRNDLCPCGSGKKYKKCCG